MLHVRHLAVVCGLCALLTACGGGGGTSAAAPRVNSVTPAPFSSTGQPPTAVTVLFDRPIAAASVNTQTFLLSFSGGDGIFNNGNDITLFALSLSMPDSRTVVFDLSALPTLPDEFYQLRLVGTGDTPMTGTDGTTLDGEFGGTFPSGNGGAGGDFVMTFRASTSVDAMTPAPNSTVAAPTTVDVTLSADIDPATLVASAFRLLRAGGDGNFNDGDEVALSGPISQPTPGTFRMAIGAAPRPADLYRVTLVASGAGDALRLDGFDDFANVPNATEFRPGTGSWTVECWAFLEDETRDNGLVECAVGDFSEGWRLGQNASGNFFFSIDDGAATRTASGGPAPAANEWHHVAGVYDAGTGEARLYIDGVLADTDATGALGSIDPTTALHIGRMGTTTLLGSVDEVRIWAVARTGTEISRDLYRGLTGTEPGLNGYWRFDMPLGQGLADTTPNANSGTLGPTGNATDEDPVKARSTAWPVVRDLAGNPIDGTFNGTLPSGIGRPGVDFVATFTIS